MNRFEREVRRIAQYVFNSSSGGSSYLVADKEITNNEILNMTTVFPEIIPAPGENKVIVMLQALLYWDVAAGAYGNVDGTNDILLAYGTDAIQNASSLVECPSGTINRVQILIPWAGDSNSGAGIESATMEDVNCVNLPLVAIIYNGNSGNLNGGNAANTLKVRVWYQIVDIPMF